MVLENWENDMADNGNKRYWLLNVPGVGGYSILVHCEADNENKALEIAAMNHVFIDDSDIFFATCAEATEKDIEFYNKFKAIIEL